MLNITSVVQYSTFQVLKINAIILDLVPPMGCLILTCNVNCGLKMRFDGAMHLKSKRYSWSSYMFMG